MQRRDVIALGLASVVGSFPLCSAAQSRRPRVGILWHAANAEEEQPYFGGLMEGFTSLGYVDGRNIQFDHRFPNEIPERFRLMAQELVALKVDVLVGVGANSSQHVKNATSTIPTVFMYVPDPVGSKLVASLARPGGNTTGLTNSSVELTERRFYYLKVLNPALSVTGLLVNPNAKVSALYVDQANAAAKKMGLMLRVFEAKTLDELPAAFEAMTKARIQALVVNSEGLFFQGRGQLAALAKAHKLPMCVWSRESLEAGALMAYGPDQVAISRRVAVYVDRILKGTKPADIPVEQPTKFDFLINEKTAAALGVRIPQSLLVSATEIVR